MQHTFIEHILYIRLVTKDIKQNGNFKYFKNHLYMMPSNRHLVDSLKDTDEEMAKHCYRRDSIQSQ